MKKNITLSFLSFMSILNAQNHLKINFEQIKVYNPSASYVGKTTLIQNNSQALYIEFYNDTIENTETEEGNLIVSLEGGKSVYFKDYTNNSMLYENTIQFKHFPTKEKIDLIQWEIMSNETEEVLGYTCQAAVTEFRGRTYVAYFTNELGFSGGPWKFDGLPGMILKVYSLDGVVEFEAQVVEVKKSLFEIENVFKEMKKLITYEEFKEIYKNKYHEVNRTEITESGGTLTRSMPACQIECHVVE